MKHSGLYSIQGQFRSLDVLLNAKKMSTVNFVPTSFDDTERTSFKNIFAWISFQKVA